MRDAGYQGYYLFLSRIRGLAISGVLVETEGRAAARPKIVRQCDDSAATAFSSAVTAFKFNRAVAVVY